MPRPKIRVVSPDEVKISREGDTAVFVYADERMGAGMHLKIGPQVQTMTDAELLDAHNDMARSIEASRQEYEHVAVEIPVGKPQIEYDERCFSWHMRGDVLRCYIGANSDTDDGEMEPEMEIDGKRISWKEFGRMLMTFEGWGMRVAIVPDDELHIIPEIKVMESRHDKFQDLDL